MRLKIINMIRPNIETNIAHALGIFWSDRPTDRILLYAVISLGGGWFAHTVENEACEVLCRPTMRFI